MSRYALPELPLVAMGAHSEAEKAKSKRQAGLTGAIELKGGKRRSKSHRKASHRKAHRKSHRKTSRKSHRKSHRKAHRKSCRCGH